MFRDKAEAFASDKLALQLAQEAVASGDDQKLPLDRFGRYPHRNKILGRDSTTEELEFLKSPNSSF